MDKQLIILLAEIDALWAPIRGEWPSPGPNAILERREDFSKLGLPIPRGGGDAADRKRFEREIDRLEKSGRVIFHRTNGRRTHYRLSDMADWQLRRQATGSDYPEMHTAMIALQALEDAGYTNRGMVSEWGLAIAPGDDGLSDEAKMAALRVEDILLAALTRGLVRSWSSGYGANVYHLSDEGREFLKHPAEPEVDWPEYCGESFEHYFSAREEGKVSRHLWKPTHTNNVCIPLNEGDWPGEEDRCGIPAIFDRYNEVRTPEAMAAAIAEGMQHAKSTD